MKKITLTKNILNENSEGLQAFFRSIDKFHIYSGEEQMELARRIKQGDEKARELLINSNYKFVVSCAKKYTNQGVSLMDLIQSGIIGLSSIGLNCLKTLIRFCD